MSADNRSCHREDMDMTAEGVYRVDVDDFKGNSLLRWRRCI